MSKFDKIIQRVGTNSVKYDGLVQFFGVEDAQPLWVADMDFAAPKFVQKALKKKIDQQSFGYEITSEQFYSSIIRWQKRNKLYLAKENILFCAGVVPSLSAAIRAFSEVGDEVIIQPPVYFPFFSVVTDNNRVLVTNPLQKKEDKYYMDFADLKKKITSKTKLLILCSPHNPIGRVWRKKELQQLHTICKEHNIMVISDEIHADIVFKKFTSYATIDKNTLILNAPSKTFNVAGFHSSYAFSFDNEIIQNFKRELQKAHLSSLNTLSNTLIEQCYSKKGEKWLEELLEYLQKNIEFTEKFIQKHLFNIEVIKSEATYLLWLDFSKYGLSHKKIKQKLLYGAKVALNDGITFGKNGQYFFRLNIALPKSELKKALKKIQNEFG
jgi:cysteine-S-conjugate beta-lyase